VKQKDIENKAQREGGEKGNSQWEEVSFGRKTNPLTNRGPANANGINRLSAEFLPHILSNSLVGLMINTTSGQIKTKFPRENEEHQESHRKK